MLVSVIAMGVAVFFMPHASIMTEKLARRGLRVHHDYETDILQQTRVADTMDRNAPTVAANMRVGELADRIARRDPEVFRHQALLVVNVSGGFEAIITRGDILRALEREPSGVATVFESGSSKLVVAYPDEALSEASDKMLRYDVGRLPVVARADQQQIVGYIGRPNIMAARLRRMEEEQVREPGWIGGRASVRCCEISTVAQK
jgi:chloride channel protein, CIC family